MDLFIIMQQPQFHGYFHNNRFLAFEIDSEFNAYVRLEAMKLLYSRYHNWLCSDIIYLIAYLPLNCNHMFGWK